MAPLLRSRSAVLAPETSPIPKCPQNAAWPRQNVTTLDQNVRYLNQNVRLFSVNLFFYPLFSITCRVCPKIFLFRPPSDLGVRVREKRNLKLETRNSRPCAVSSFQFPVSNFESEAMGKGTWRSRGRARQGRPRASRAYPAAPFRAEDTPPSGTASNCSAIILWITYQEIKRAMRCDLTRSDLDEALPQQLRKQ